MSIQFPGTSIVASVFKKSMAPRAFIKLIDKAWAEERITIIEIDEKNYKDVRTFAKYIVNHCDRVEMSINRIKKERENRE